MTPVTVVHVPAPDGLECRLYPVAALCVLSIVGAAQVTMRALPTPGASDAALGAFGADGAAAAVESVLVGDHMLVPVALTPWTCTSIGELAARPDRLYGLVTFLTVVQVPAPAGLYCRLKPVAALCVLSTTGGAQVTVRLLPVPCASDGAPGGFEMYDAGVGGSDGAPGNVRITARGRFDAKGGFAYIGIVLRSLMAWCACGDPSAVVQMLEKFSCREERCILVS